MKDVLLAVVHLAGMTAKLCGSGGVRGVIAENLLLNRSSSNCWSCAVAASERRT
jgi:hypothetical protein